MKTLALTIIAIAVSVVLSAQNAMPFKYQAVLRSETGDILADQNVSLRFSILTGEFFDNTQYSEIYDINTNEYGMVTLNIGEGYSVEGSFEDISWNSEFIWLKVEIDQDAGLNFTEMGISRLLAVPFANYAAKADYNNLDNLPVLFDGNYNSLSNTPELFDGDYNSLTNKPELFSGDYNDLDNSPALFDGEWNSINGKPDFSAVATSGNYADLSNLPVLFGGDYTELTNAPVLFSGSYDDLTNKPELFDGTWTNLSGKPIFQTVAYSGSYHDLEDLPILFNGNYNNLTNKPILFDGTWTSLSGKPTFATVATSGSYNDLSSKPNLTVYATKDMGGQNITNLGDPVNSNDAVTKEYVDELEAKLEALEEMLVSYGTMVRDYDGNIYNTVKIGTQTWMAENLRTTHTADGTPIALYYSANGNSANDESYGLLYNWSTVMNGAASSNSSPSGVTGICPVGWHIPSDSEWKTMEAYLGMDATELNLTLAWRGTDQGTQLKPGGTTGFNSTFAGIRYDFNNYVQFNNQSVYWTSTQYTATTSLIRQISTSESEILRNQIIKGYFLGVRCIKD